MKFKYLIFNLFFAIMFACTPVDSYGEFYRYISNVSVDSEGKVWISVYHGESFILPDYKSKKRLSVSSLLPQDAYLNINTVNDGKNISVVGSYIYHSRDGGANWTKSDGLRYGHSNFAWYENTGIITSDNGLGYTTAITRDNGENWVFVEMPTTSDIYKSGIKHATVFQNRIWLKDEYSSYFSNDYGATWKSKLASESLEASLYGYSFLSEKIVFAVNNNAIYKTINAGNSWEKLTEFDHAVDSVFAIGEHELLATIKTPEKKFFHSIDSGGNWYEFKKPSVNKRSASQLSETRQSFKYENGFLISIFSRHCYAIKPLSRTKKWVKNCLPKKGFY